MASVDWAGKISAYLRATGAPVAGVGDLLAALGDGCQRSVERHIGRTFDAQAFTDVYTGNGKPKLFLRHDPIWTLSSVSINGVAQVIQTDFTTVAYPLPVVAIDPGQQSLILTDGSTWDCSRVLNVSVAYTAGLTGPYDFSPPGDLVSAVTLWAAQLFRDRDRIGLTSSVVGGQNVGISHDIPPTVMTMANKYRRVFIPN